MSEEIPVRGRHEYPRSLRPIRLALALGVFFSALATSPPAEAHDWVIGDVFVGVSNGQYKVYSNSGVFKETISNGLGSFTTGCAFNRGLSRLYTTSFFATKVVAFDTVHPHTIVQTIDTAPQSEDGRSESVVFDGAGSFYVGHPHGNRDILKYNAAGTFQTQFNAAVEALGTDWIDLARDQKTLFYTSEGRKVKRFDVSANEQLADFATLPGGPGADPPTAEEFRALRLLPPGDGSGGLLVADHVNIKRLNSSGGFVMAYDPLIDGETNLNLWFAVALDPNGTSFWAGDEGGTVVRLNIATGAVEVGPFNTGTGASTLFGICTKGEPTAAADNDGDEVVNADDNAVNDHNHDQADQDGDGVGDAADNCWNFSNASQTDADADGQGKACDSDDDPGTGNDNSVTFPGGGTFAQGAFTLVTFRFTYQGPVAIQVLGAPDCPNVTATATDAQGNIVRPRDNHLRAYVHPQDTVTWNPGETKSVTCEVFLDLFRPEVLGPGGYTLQGTYSAYGQLPGANLSILVLTTPTTPFTVAGTLVNRQAVDIKPDGFPNSINAGAKGVVPIAILSNAGFDATQVDPLTVLMAGKGVQLRKKGTAMTAIKDVNGDGLLDFVVHVDGEALALNETDAYAEVTFRLNGSSVTLTGVDTVKIVPQ